MSHSAGQSRMGAEVEFDRVSPTKLAVDGEQILAEASLRAAALVAADALGASE
ncbi:hypothetical protein [Streptomyces sp. NPDC058424]|uniref:hypothetical protein n=1 Tax=Streptomyces sp. NPDC058424 TaxID=3346491 RepID=UPI00365663EA